MTALGGVWVARARSRETLDALAQLVLQGALNPHVTTIFPLAEAASALRLVEEGHARGKVVIEVPE
ncbi:zinc-binding dehydrogenase [Acrocarpospora sp. B8E8]|uniref:zinc-binding dehydrogenase n=1 Tax=Acrocarpospora sp. B8E8 TaxID=3153572 RepID=UPI00325F6DF0